MLEYQLFLWAERSQYAQNFIIILLCWGLKTLCFFCDLIINILALRILLYSSQLAVALYVIWE